MFSVLIGLGTNLGDRQTNLIEAKRLLAELVGNIENESSVYQTAAWGITNQPDFLNQVVQLQTNLLPFHLISVILQIEQKMGRRRITKWGERLIDIDILFFDKIILTTSNLIIPHPFIHQRNFVLKPLFEIHPNFIHPVFLKSIRELTNNTTDESDTSKL